MRVLPVFTGSLFIAEQSLTPCTNPYIPPIIFKQRLYSCFWENAIGIILIKSLKNDCYLPDIQAIVFLAFNQDNTDGVFPKTTVKSLFEDDRGDIWIGTWSQGLFRYEKRTGKYRKYPQMNSGNSAHVVFQDSHKNIWVGTWGSRITFAA